MRLRQQNLRSTKLTPPGPSSLHRTCTAPSGAARMGAALGGSRSSSVASERCTSWSCEQSKMLRSCDGLAPPPWSKKARTYTENRVDRVYKQITRIQVGRGVAQLPRVGRPTLEREGLDLRRKHNLQGQEKQKQGSDEGGVLHNCVRLTPLPWRAKARTYTGT